MSNVKTRTNDMHSIPDDIVLYVLSYLTVDIPLYCACARVSKQFNTIMGTETIWKTLFLKDFPYTDKMITKNYKFAYKELRTYLENWYKLTDMIPLSIIGTTGSGKSTMIQRYVYGTFQLEYNPGLMEYYRYNFSI